MKLQSIRNRYHSNPQTSHLAETLRSLNIKNTTASSKLIKILDGQVKKYIDSNDENLTRQVSKNQLIKSREKVYYWHRSNNDFIYDNKVCTSNFMKFDNDPSQIDDVLPMSPSKKAKTLKSKSFFKQSAVNANVENYKNTPIVCENIKMELSFSEWLRQWNKLVDVMPKIKQIDRERFLNQKELEPSFRSINKDLFNAVISMEMDVCKIINISSSFY